MRCAVDCGNPVPSGKDASCWVQGALQFFRSCNAEVVVPWVTLFIHCFMKPDSIETAQPLNDRIAEWTRQKIINGEFSPGQRLSEASLSASLDISRNTLREVFRLL